MDSGSDILLTQRYMPGSRTSDYCRRQFNPISEVSLTWYEQNTHKLYYKRLINRHFLAIGKMKPPVKRFFISGQSLEMTLSLSKGVEGLALND